MKTAILLGIGLLVLAVQFPAAAYINCKTPFYIGRDDEDCSIWFTCSYGVPTEKKCPGETVFNLKHKICVNKGSVNDDCPLTKPPSPADKCKGGYVRMVFAKPDNCAQFYDCSLRPRPPGLGYLGDYVGECTYPTLFSETTRKCESFESVSCGSRKEIKYACDYEREKCFGPYCQRCEYKYPDCRGLSDGNQVWKEKKESPYYAYCYKERGFSQECPSGSRIPLIFSSTTKTCEVQFELFNYI